MSFKRLHIYLLLIVSTFIWSCGNVSYTFTGASFDEDVKTISVAYFPNYAPLANPTLSQSFTEALKDIFINQTNLDLIQKNGDLQFEGSITGYRTSPIAITGNETAALKRLTITVKVKFTNTKDSERDFETTFSRFADYESSQSLAQVEDQLIEEINGQLTQDIFNKAASNW